MSKKISELLNEFDNQKVYLKSNPAVIQIESVSGCPFTCVMCKAKPTHPIKISERLLKKIEPYYKDLEVLAVHGDGEPLLADLDYFIEHSVNHDYVLHMNTTGFLLNEKITDLLLKTRLSIRFSIHAGRAKTYKRIMGVSLDKVKEGIIYLVEGSKNSKKSHDFWFSFIVMNENIDEIEDFLHFTHDCGIKRVRFMALSSNPSSLKGVRIRNLEFYYFKQFNKKIVKKFLSKLPLYKKLAEELNITIEYGTIQNYFKRWNTTGELANKVTGKIIEKRFFPLKPSRGSCIAPWIGQLNIYQDGNVKLCCGARYSLGNLNCSTLVEIWNSKKMRRIRKTFSKGRYPRICGYCKGFGFSAYPHNSFSTVKR